MAPQLYTVLLLVLVGAFVYRWRQRSEDRRFLRLCAIPLFLLILISMPYVAYLLKGSLEWQYEPLTQRPDDVDAIVVLGGDNLPRCLRAAELYRQGKPCLVIVSGYDAVPVQPELTAKQPMQDILQVMGVPADRLVIEDQSRDTFENAVETCKIIRQRGLRTVLLVTTADHLVRATACFRKQGVDPIPAGCRYRSAAPPRNVLAGCLPVPGAVRDTHEAVHEWVGLCWYWLRGRI